ncbi:MAG: methionine--tRNA ligase [Bdellovibrionota bacterium]
MKDTFYITTPIYYVNDYPHIGHAYTTVAADVLARYHRQRGKKVHFLTGTDEHGQKIEKAAQKKGESPIELADRVVGRFEGLWEALNISHNDFIRTSQDRHKQGALDFFQRCLDQGDIYEGEYEGWYSVNDEEFLTETHIAELGKDIENDPNIVRLKESTYFFRLSKYQDQLLQHIESHPHFIAPESRKNEVISFIKQGLKDLSISRTSFSWGIPLPNNSKHVLYVWFDALSNYITALDFHNQGKLYQEFWPANVHLVGKDILRFHAIFWPIFLMSAGLPLPEQIFAHGWWTVEGQKMSKSKGNFVDPFAFVDQYGRDAFRYFLLREFSFGQDGNFAQENFVARLNADLANELGNLVSRSLSMLEKYRDGKIPPQPSSSELSEWIAEQAQKYQQCIEEKKFDQAFANIWKIFARANQYIEQKQPWSLAKDPASSTALDQVLYELMEVIRMGSALIYPIMPDLSTAIRDKLSLTPIECTVGKDFLTQELNWGLSVSGSPTKKGSSLFMRIES